MVEEERRYGKKREVMEDEEGGPGRGGKRYV